MSYESYDDAVLYDAYVDADSYDDDYSDPYDDDYSDSYDDDYSERRRRGQTRTRPARGAQGVRMGRTSPGVYRGQGTIETPAGKAKVNLPPDLVTKKEFNELQAKVLANNKAILKNGKAIEVLNGNTKRLDSGLVSQGKTLNGVQKNVSGIQQGLMVSALLPPKLESVTISDVDKAIDATLTTPDNPTKATVKSASFDSMTTLLPLMMSGGMGGGSGSSASNNNMNMMLPMVLLLNNKDDDKKDDNTMLMVVMMMMMNNK